MKIKLLLLLTCFFTINNVNARDDRLMFSVKDVMDRAKAENMIDDSVKYYFGDMEHPEIKNSFGEIKTNKKTNAFNKTDKEACEWAFLGAIKAFHKKAKNLGADAVINIQSNYKNIPINDSSNFECGAGTWVAGVALKGDFVKLK